MWGSPEGEYSKICGEVNWHRFTTEPRRARRKRGGRDEERIGKADMGGSGFTAEARWAQKQHGERQAGEECSFRV